MGSATASGPREGRVSAREDWAGFGLNGYALGFAFRLRGTRRGPEYPSWAGMLQLQHESACNRDINHECAQLILQAAADTKGCSLPLLTWKAWDKSNARSSEQIGSSQIKCRLVQTSFIQGGTASKERMQGTYALHPLNANLGDLWWNKIFVCSQQHLLDHILFVSISLGTLQVHSPHNYADRIDIRLRLPVSF